MVRGMGLEPTQYCYHWNLNPARLPIPPPPREYYVLNFCGFGKRAPRDSCGTQNSFNLNISEF